MSIIINGYPLETANNRKTFAGVLSLFCDEIAVKSGWNENTYKSYLNQYRNILIPKTLVNLSLDEYDESDFVEVINKLTKNKDYSEATIRHYRHLIKVVVDAGVRHGICSDILSYTAFDIPEEDLYSKRNRHLLSVRKSLTVEQNIVIAIKLLKSPKDITGEDLGLLLMFFCGLRNNEAVSVTYGDLKPLDGHPGVWCLYISKSTKEKSVARKASGKTPNSPRILPLPTVLSGFLLERKKYIEGLYSKGKIDLEGTNPVFGVNGLLMACHGKKYNTACQADDLGRQAKKLFDTIPGVDFDSLRVLDLERMQNEEVGGFFEKEPTAYLFRHNLATMLYNIGFESHEVQYYIGHDIENTEMIRNDFVNPEILYHLWEKIEMHPLNKLPLYPSGEKMDKDSKVLRCQKGKRMTVGGTDSDTVWMVSACAKEPGQKCNLSVSKPNSIVFRSKKSVAVNLPYTVEIQTQLQEVYFNKFCQMMRI